MPDPIQALGAALRRPDPARTLGGQIVEQIDASHVTVDLGDRTIPAFVPGSLASSCTLGADMRVSVEGNQATVIWTSTPSLPVGTLAMWLGATAPDGWLILAGGTASRTEQAALFALWGTTYGAGDGSTTFGLPDMRDRTPVGASATKTVGSTGGAATHTHTQTLRSTWAYSTGSAGLKYTDGTETTPSPVTYTGSSSSLPPYRAVNFIVKT